MSNQNEVTRAKKQRFYFSLLSRGFETRFEHRMWYTGSNFTKSRNCEQKNVRNSFPPFRVRPLSDIFNTLLQLWSHHWKLEKKSPNRPVISTHVKGLFTTVNNLSYLITIYKINIENVTSIVHVIILKQCCSPSSSPDIYWTREPKLRSLALRD